MGGYCAVTAILWKRFWAQGDFWSGGKGRALFWDFLKNLSLGAGFLLIAIQPNGHGLAQTSRRSARLDPSLCARSRRWPMSRPPKPGRGRASATGIYGPTATGSADRPNVR